MMPSYKRAGRLLLGLFVLHVLLVTTHLGEFWPAERHHELGEFWPFSIYPMFSQGGKPWARSLVRELPDPNMPDRWHPRTLATLPGTAYALARAGVLQNDVAALLNKTETWDAPRVAALRRTFGDEIETKVLMLYRVEGRIQADSVAVVCTPFVLLRPDSTAFNPNLDLRSD